MSINIQQKMADASNNGNTVGAAQQETPFEQLNIEEKIARLHAAGAEISRLFIQTQRTLHRVVDVVANHTHNSDGKSVVKQDVFSAIYRDGSNHS